MAGNQKSNLRIATFNVNGVNGRLQILLDWLRKTEPDIVCLQELKAPQEKFPVEAINAAGYGAIWQGQKAGTAWRSSPAAASRWIRKTCRAAISKPPCRVS
jgi:exonuclease III